MTTEELISLEHENVMQTYARFPIAIDHGKGAVLYSPEGKKYIDFTSGIGVCSLGYGNDEWCSAISAQAKKLAHVSNLFYTEPCIRAASVLTKRAGMKNVFFSNSGAEANEGMIKLARKYSFDKYGKGRSTIITLNKSFHGRTITTLKATGQEHFHMFFYPFTEGFRYADAENMDSLKEAYGSDVCAVMIELIQGEGGVFPLSVEYVQALASFCAENDLLLLIDEVQTGVGRTGTLFAYEQYGVKPDVVSFAKGIGGGLPLGGFLANEKCGSVLGFGMHGSTFGGNPVCCAGAQVILNTIDEKFLADVAEKGAYLRSAVESWKLPCIVTTRGLGMMIGIQVKGVTHKDAVAAMIDAGLLCLTAGSDTIRLLPPLVITKEEIDEGLAIMKSVLEKY